MEQFGIGSGPWKPAARFGIIDGRCRIRLLVRDANPFR
jgi:hypothetical protein